MIYLVLYKSDLILTHKAVGYALSHYKALLFSPDLKMTIMEKIGTKETLKKGGEENKREMK